MVHTGSLTGDRWAIQSDTPVVISGEEVGRIVGVIVKPPNGEIAGVVVRRGLLVPYVTVIPMEVVGDASREQVRLHLAVAELDRQPQYRGEDARSLADGLLRTGQRIVCADGAVGTLALVLLDAVTQRALWLVVRHDSLIGEQRLVPVEWLDVVGGDLITLDVGLLLVAQMPEYRSDDAVTGDVFDALWCAPDLAPADLSEVQEQASDGTVWLEGVTRTEHARARIVSVVLSVRGVLAVRDDYLQSLEALAAATTGLHGPDKSSPGGRPQLDGIGYA